MKFRRMLAALLSALMITSCMSFVAGAQETQTISAPVSSYTAKGAHGSFRVMGGLTKTRMYDAVEDVVFYHHTNIPNGKKHYDAYGLGTVPVTNGLIYFAADIRTNYSATPSLNVYGAKLTGSTDTSGGYFSAASATKADGNWERVVVEIKNDKLESFNQNHIMLLGSSTPADFIGDKYLDVAVFGYFNDEYSALNYDFGTVTAPNGVASFSVDGAVTTEVPTADPEVEDGFFMGWSADENAARGAAVTALSTVPDTDTTYYPIVSGLIEDETAVYLSNNGDDANSGRHSKAPVKTLTKANEIIASEEGINKLVIVGTFTTTDSTDYYIGVADKPITVTGYDETAIFDYDARKGGSDDNLYFNGSVTFENINIIEGSGDGRMRTFGNTVTFGDGVATISGAIDIAPNGGSSSLITVNSGAFARMYAGGFSDGNSFTGTSKTIINGGSVDQLGFGWGYNSCQNFSGTYEAEINGGSVNVITLDSGKPAIGSADASYGHQSTNAYRGLRYYTLNDGTVNTIVTTSKDTYGNDGANTAAYRTGVTVYEINKAGIVTGSIITGRSGDDDATRVVIYNNGSYVDGQVADTGAIVVNAIGGTLSADTTVAEDYTGTLNGFTYETEFNYYDTVKIGDKEIALADLENGIIPASEFAAGVNTVEFFFKEEEHIAAYRAAGAKIAYVSKAGTGNKNGTSPVDAYAGLLFAMSSELKTTGKVVFAVLDDVEENGGGDASFPVDTVITSVGGDIYFKAHPKFKSNNGGNIVIENIDIYHTIRDGGTNINSEVYLVSQGNDLTMRNVNAYPYGELNGTPRTEKLYVQPGGDGGNFTKTADTKLVLENVTGIYVRGGGYGGSTFAGGIDYVVGGKSEFSSILAGIQAAGSSAQKTVNDDLQFDANGNPVTNQPEANRTVNGDIAVAVKDEAKITTITATNYGILKGDLVITVQDDATVGTIDFAASSISKKNQDGSKDVVMSAGRLEGNGIVYILGGSVGTVKGKQGAKRIVVADLNKAEVGTISDAHAVTYVGNGTVSVSEDYSTFAVVPGEGVKYIRITNGTDVKEYNVAGDEVTLAADLSAIPLVEGVNAVEFLNDGTEVADYTIETYTMGTDGAYGEAVTETKTAEVGTTVTFEPEAKTGFTIADTSVLTGTAAEDGSLVLKVYYARNQYKLYTKADAEAEAVEAGTYYYEAALTAPATPEKDGYTFKAWDPTVPATMPANDVTLTATWEKNAPTTATLKFYADAEAADAWVTKTVDIGATADVFPIWSDVGRETKGTNDIFAYPDNAQMHFLGWSTDGTVENIVVRETYTATADDDFYAVWENLDLLTTEEITVTNIVTADDFTVPADAEKFEHLKVDGAFTGITTIYNADGTEYKAIGTGEKYPGLGGANTTINSYVGSLGSETATVLFPAGSAMYPIWMKFNDGKVIGAKTTLSGELNVAFVFNASPSDTTARGFWISAGDISGTYNLTPANTVEGGSKEYVVTLKTTLEEGDLLAYAAPYNFDNNTVKAAQLEAIYVWADAPVITKANATFDANGGAWADGETTKTVETVVGETPVAPTEAPTKAGHAFEGWTPELTAMTADGATYTAKWTANNYTVTYKVDGEVYGEVETYAYGADVTMREAPTKTGYTFSGWDKTLTTMPAENVEINGTFTANNYTVTYKVDGEVYGNIETYAYGAAVTMREAPTKTGYTFSGWDKTLTTMPAENVEINGTFTEDVEPFPTSATYKTYGKYDVLNDTYTVEVKFAGAKVNQGSLGFKFPTSYMTFKNVKANSAAGIEFLGDISPIYASGEGYYADTWAVTNMANAGNIDATTEEVLIATFTFGMTKDQRTAFETALADENYKFEEYVVENADAKYHNGTYYLATPYSTGFDTTKTPITYASHTDTETAPEITYTTYGKYDEYNGTYSIEIKVKGSKINLGAFGLAFNADHMTFDPEAENAVVLAENIANYLGITLHNAADGYAFAFDGSSTEDGYIDASTEEVLLATINLTMTPEQRAAFEAAGKTMNILVPTANETVDAETLAKYFDGENYLVSIYVAGLATPKLPAEYIKHNDEVIEATVADVDVKVTFASKNGATVANIAQIRLDDNEAIALEAAGNEEATLTYSFKELKIGQKYTVTVEKNGYLAGVAEITVVKGENTIEMTLIAGDIKGAEADACGDGKIDLSDFVRLIRAFDTDASDDFIATVDIDESGAVNVADLAIIKANFNNTSADNTITINGVSNNEEAAG